MTKPTHPVELIVCAISTQEGELLSHTRNNPGNLRYAEQHGASRPDGHEGPIRPVEPVAQFVTWEAGVVALWRDTWAKVATGMTLRAIIYVFAPPNENNSAEYLSNVAEWTRLPLETPIINILPPLIALNGSAE